MTGLKARSPEMSDKLCGMIGLAQRAGKLVIGTEQVCTMLAKRGAIELVCVSATASDATKKKILTKCEYYGVKAITVDIEIGELGRIIGKTYTPACIGVTDENLAREIARLATVS